ncbi:Tubulin--tyrosine ligase-like protein 9 [Plasmodiophora brassicae]
MDGDDLYGVVRAGGVAFDVVADGDEEKTGAPVEQRRPRSTTTTRVFLKARQQLVHAAVGRLGWERVRDSRSWSLAWVDTADSAFYRAMRAGQRVSQMPGMEQLSRKKNLGRNLNAMREAFPEEYNMFPVTWCLPEDYRALRGYAEHHEGAPPTFIVKPDGRCAGRGIFLADSLDRIDAAENQVCQLYVDPPYLLDGLKFDLRMYALLTSVDPLRVYLYRDGLVRFCTEPYVAPVGDNLSHTFSHLTNYALNKTSGNYAEGSKWSYAAFIDRIRHEDPSTDTNALWDGLQDIVAKACIAGGAVLRHEYRLRFPVDHNGGSTFQLLGFDIVLDKDLRPWLVEINRNPSLRCDTPVDEKVKSAMLADLLYIVSASSAVSSDKPRLDRNQRKALYPNRCADLAMLELERSADGGFQRVLPVLDGEGVPPDAAARYQTFVDHAQSVFDSRTQRSIKKTGVDVQPVI